MPHLAVCSWEEGPALELSQRACPPSSVPLPPEKTTRSCLLPQPVLSPRSRDAPSLCPMRGHGVAVMCPYGCRWKKDVKSVRRPLAFTSEGIPCGVGIQSWKSQLATSSLKGGKRIKAVEMQRRKQRFQLSINNLFPPFGFFPPFPPSPRTSSPASGHHFCSGRMQEQGQAVTGRGWPGSLPAPGWGAPPNPPAGREVGALNPLNGP